MTVYQETPAPGTITEDFMNNLEDAGDSWDPNDVFAKKTGVFCEDLVMSIYNRVDRALQEILDPVPLNKASALARVSSSRYIPVLAIPFESTITIFNNNEDGTVVRYEAGRKFVSELDIIYTLVDSVIVNQGETVTANVNQHILTTTNIESDGSNFQEIPIGDHSVSQFSVRVAGILYENNNKIIEVGPTTLSYYTRFDREGLLSAMFGNDIRGKAPSAGVTISLSVYNTEGAAGNLLSGAKLGEYNPTTPQNSEVRIATVTTKGVDQESWQDMLKSIPFFEQNKGGLGWRDGYVKTIRDGFPDLLWLKFWNKEEEETYSAASVDNTNRLFISAYSADGQGTLGTRIVDHLNDQHKPDVARFTWVEPIQQSATISITGIVDKIINIDNATAAILKALRMQFDIDYVPPEGEVKPQNRISVVNSEVGDLVKNILVDGYGVFDDHIGDASRVARPKYSVAVGGTTEPIILNDLITVSEANITINLTKL